MASAVAAQQQYETSVEGQQFGEAGADEEMEVRAALVRCGCGCRSEGDVSALLSFPVR